MNINLPDLEKAHGPVKAKQIYHEVCKITGGDMTGRHLDGIDITGAPEADKKKIMVLIGEKEEIKKEGKS